MGSATFDDVLSAMPKSVAQRAKIGAQRAIAKRDPTMIYHYLSMNSPDHYGAELPYVHDGYYKSYPGVRKVHLPPPPKLSGKDLFEVILSRRSRRRYAQSPLLATELSALLFYSLGITGRAWWGGPKRAYPSSGALQPVEGYVSVRSVEGVEAGIYHYNPAEMALEELKKGDHSKEVMKAAIGQEHVGSAAAVIMMTAVYRRTASKYGLRGYRYVHLDAGFAGQNIYLVAEALGLATVAVGGFYDELVCELLDLDCEEEIPVVLFAIGRRV
ncbi:MAG: SagB/ThcOx family dehydrogenase [Acidilobaceae archaeon]|nr:SagB/ThcOx family dehydrogenase [Acidilobaceae archaeon]MCX8165893.1 SagB/ThcOx family dehydrogenase [Acidilobaceae archaeon]MDW7974535.1 SagB/ThcOx family dehydrogenase [Sulfolobales archaeon]